MKRREKNVFIVVIIQAIIQKDYVILNVQNKVFVNNIIKLSIMIMFAKTGKQTAAVFGFEKELLLWLCTKF